MPIVLQLISMAIIILDIRREKMNIIKWIDYARKSIKICEQIKEVTDKPIRGEMARIKAIKDIRTIMREV